MEKVSQGKIIKEAFQAKIPKDRSEWPDYYRERMDICDTCEHNTKNGGKGDYVEWAAKKTGIHNCSICGCVISKKCWSKNEACGLEELKQIPKWNRIVVETVKEDLFNLMNKSTDQANVNLSEDGTMFEFYVKERYPDDDLKLKFVVECKENMILREVHICSCVISKPNMLAPGIYELEFEFRKPHNIGNWFKTASIVFEDPVKKGAEGKPVQKHLVLKFFVPIKYPENDGTQKNNAGKQKESDNKPS